jgi:transposase
MSTPEGWVTVQEAAQITGALENQIRTAARRIKRGHSYTIYGRPQRWRGAPSDLPVLPGEQLKCLHGKKIMLNRDMVTAWKQALDRIREARAQGARTEREIAAEIGITVAEVRRMVKRIEQEEQVIGLQKQGRTIEEIAQALGMTAATVRRRLQHTEKRGKRAQQHQGSTRP